MNITKMMAALACAATVGFSAQAADWFNGGIEAGWPDKAVNGSWSGSTTTSSYSDNKLNIVLNDNKDPLTFTADISKKVGVDVDSVTFASTVGFSAYDMGELPAVPAEAKAAITFVATDEDATAGKFYYLAYDGTSANVWVASDVTSAITDNFSASQSTTVTVAHGAEGYWAVTYEFLGDDPVTINTTVKKTTATDYVSTMEFAGNGPGFAKELTGTTAEKTVAVTVGEYEKVTVTNIMHNGELKGIENVRLPKDAENVTVFFAAKDGYKFTDGNTTVIAGPIEADFVINSSSVKAPNTEESDVTLLFYDMGGNDLTDEYTATPGKEFAGADEVKAAAADAADSVPGKWWDGTWCTPDGEPIAFPDIAPADDTEYWMVGTNIQYRTATEGGDGAIVIWEEDGPEESFEGYTIDDDVCGKLVSVAGHPEKEGYDFIGWTCEYFDLTTPTFSDDIKMNELCRMPENFESWDNVGDIIFVANWESKGVTPDVPVVVVAETEEEALEKAGDVVAESPDTEIVSDEDYTAYFTKKAYEVEAGSWIVTAELKDEIVVAADETAELAADLGDIAAGTATSVSLTDAKPGLYYSAKFTDDLTGMSGAGESARNMADATGAVTIDTPTTGDGSKMFYQIQVNTTAE